MTSALPEAAKAAIRGLSHPEGWPVIMTGFNAGRWGWEVVEAYSAMTNAAHAPPAPPKPRLPPKTRLHRWDERPTIPSARFVQKRSLDPTLDWAISDGAFRCLDLLVSLGMKTGVIVTNTAALAKQLGRTTRTVQNYYLALIDAGYIERDFDRRTGRVTIRLTALVQPPPFPASPRTGGAKLASGINRVFLYQKDSPAHARGYQQSYPQMLWKQRPAAYGNGLSG